MHKRYILAGIRFGFAALALAAIFAQFVYSSTKSAPLFFADGVTYLSSPNAFNPVNFFSFFTIESNVFAAVILIVAGIYTLRGKQNTTLDILRGAATLYMATTGIIYGLLLSGLEVSLQTTIPWVNVVLHYLMPVVVVVDWLLDPPRRSLTFQRALLWLLFPLAYAIYSLLRGDMTGWYPYPFINAAELGYGQVLVNSVFIAVGLTFLVWLVVLSANLQQRRKATEQTL